MATRPYTDGLSELRDRIEQSLRELGQDVPAIEVLWLTRGSDDAEVLAEVLVEVTLPDPGEQHTWSQKQAGAIRTAVRQATAEVMPWAVATTRLVPEHNDA